MGAAVIGLTLWSWGQPLISTSGEVSFWVGSVWSNQNSQQVADWYTLSHIIHGMLVVLIGRMAPRLFGYRAMLSAAIATGIGWELLEHTDWVLSQFRATTIYQGYLGDSVLNAVCDYLFMLGGFFVASALSTRWAFAAALALELTSAALARDSLVLTTMSVVYPIEAVAAWQQATNPQSAVTPD